MPNWFNKVYFNNLEKSRWSFSVEAIVTIPFYEEEEQQKEVAQKVLNTVLRESEGDVSKNTLVDSDIQFQIQFEPIRI